VFWISLISCRKEERERERERETEIERREKRE
jgi:hypothetical protein